VPKNQAALNKQLVPTPGTARHVSCHFRGRRGTATRYEYKNVMNLPLLVATLALPMTVLAGEISEVRVLDYEFRDIKVLSSPIELSEFKELWLKKSVHKPSMVEWLYKLDISSKGSGGDRWLYHPDGWVQVLTKGPASLYKIPSPESFNKIIGIHNKPLEPTR
jgi:hypothetical protein